MVAGGLNGEKFQTLADQTAGTPSYSRATLRCMLAPRAAHAKHPEHFTAKQLVAFGLVEFPGSERLRGQCVNGLR